MNWRLFLQAGWISGALAAASSGIAGADEAVPAASTESPPVSSAPAADAEASPDLPSPPKPATKGKRVRGERAQKDATEGTEALGRFEADTVLKSKYQLDGQPLEVDPD
jgi:hypothetical protein